MGTFLNGAAIPALGSLKVAGAPTLLPGMLWVVKPMRSQLVAPKAAPYAIWKQWHTYNWTGWPLSMGEALRLTGKKLATSLGSSAPALLHPLRALYSVDEAPFLNQAGARSPRGVSELNAAVHFLHPSEQDREVREDTIFAEGACKAFPARQSWCKTEQHPPLRTPLCATPSSANRPGGPPSRWPPTCRAAAPTLFYSPPLSGTRGTSHRCQALRQEQPGIPLLLLVVSTCEEPEQLRGATPAHLYGPPYGAAPVPRSPTLATEAQDQVHTFRWSPQVIGMYRVHLVQLPPATCHNLRGPSVLNPPTARNSGALHWRSGSGAS